jgi:hypothetical protein
VEVLEPCYSLSMMVLSRHCRAKRRIFETMKGLVLKWLARHVARLEIGASVAYYIYIYMYQWI